MFPLIIKIKLTVKCKERFLCTLSWQLYSWSFYGSNEPIEPMFNTPYYQDNKVNKFRTRDIFLVHCT